MLNMPKLIKEWKKASSPLCRALKSHANILTDGKERLDEVAKGLSTVMGVGYAIRLYIHHVFLCTNMSRLWRTTHTIPVPP